MVLFMKSVLLPSLTTPYVPSLRVDLVALPDQKKTEVLQPPAPPAPEPVKEANPVKAEPKLAVKPADEPGDFSVMKKKKKTQSKKEKDAQKKLKEAIARIKAIERIKAMTAGEPIKGNQVSKGSALTGEAKTALETTYFDVVLERVRSYWELPKWLQDQNLQAKVMVFIDSKGNLSSYQFIKTSGSDAFDSEVKKTLQSSAPFPAPPSDIASDVSSNGVVMGFPI